MRRRLVIRILLVMLIGAAASARNAQAQMSISYLPARGALYVEMFGGSTVTMCCSLNLELPVRDDVVFRVASAREAGGEPPPQAVLFAAEKLIGGPHGRYVEVGGGLLVSTLGTPGNGQWRPGPAVNVGYRVYSNGWIRRYTFTPITPRFDGGSRTGPRMMPTIGFSIGRTF